MNLYPYERWQVEWANDTMFYLTNIGAAAATAGLGPEWLFPWFMTMVWYGANYYIHHYLPARHPEAHMTPDELEEQRFLEMMGAGGGPDPALVRKLEQQNRDQQNAIRELREKVRELEE